MKRVASMLTARLTMSNTSVLEDTDIDVGPEVGDGAVETVEIR